ncbi:VC0807 family protein [Paenibacillus radicis (ex Xue et al. 2023)]|uniref:DUF3159 domain-containing protein n=1 Tax=Paenibacillus radicis (ex Xue et al. 2023) TaxID=2972489 RepID=A0ABT1YCL3_9BACL|nr:VC0807 family protein [Paenibacillus radicis (ex Xue et al. 2023)]MCR8630934.1 hypothetical protein [Paenibacillus radicis (ex Xue et al. 2023)]
MSPLIRGLLFTILINGAAPFIVYLILEPHMSGFAALSIATVIPMCDNLMHLIRHKKMDVFAAIMLFTFLLGIGLIAMGGDEKLLLIRESFITAAVGLLFIISLLFPRPLIFHLAMRFNVKKDPQAQQAFAARWNFAYFRYVLRLMTLVWGFILLAEAAVRVILVYELTTAQFLIVSNFVFYGFIGAAILWTVAYRKHSSKRLADIIR